VPDLDGYLARWSALHGGLDPRQNPWVRGWLSITYRVARPLAERRVPPDALTAAGLGLAAGVAVLAMAGDRWPLAAVVLVLLSALVDSLDGAVAALRGSARPWGAVLDSLADRCADLLFLLALWALGAPAWPCVVAAALTMLLEYGRASAAAAGMAGVGMITVWERPSRVILTVLAMLGAGAVPRHAGVVATVAAVAATVLATVGLGQLLPVLRRRLAGSSRADQVGDDPGGQRDER